MYICRNKNLKVAFYQPKLHIRTCKMDLYAETGSCNSSRQQSSVKISWPISLQFHSSFMCTPFPLTERLALELLNDMEWCVSWSFADDVGWPLWNTLSSLLYISLLTAAVNLVINDSAVHTANTELQIIIIQKFPSHSILPKLPIKSKFVMPTKAKQVLAVMKTVPTYIAWPHSDQVKILCFQLFSPFLFGFKI